MTIEPDAPTWRGRLHLWAFVAAVPAALALVLVANGVLSIVAAAVFGLGLLLVFGTSATYHRLVRSPEARGRWRRIDHAMIYVLITASYVPLCLLVLPLPWGVPLLAVVGVGAIAGILAKLVFFGRTRRWPAMLYMAMGWAAIVASPQLVQHLGAAPLMLLVAGGLAYTVGAIIFSRQRPNPAPRTFGYHEIWHSCTVLAAACHFAMVALILPR